MAYPRFSADVPRTLLDGVLAVVRELGGCTDLEQALELIADAVVTVLGFGAAAVNVTTPDGDLRVDAVVGPESVEELLGTRRPMSFWAEVLSTAEPWGELRYFSHDRDQALLDGFVSWRPSGPAGPGPDAWHPDDTLLAPMWDEQQRLVGVLSVDQPATGRRPDAEQRTVLEMFAGQAARAISEAQARQLTDAARDEAESRWRLAFEHSPTGVGLVGVDGRILEANAALETLLGYSTDELAQMTFSEFTHPDDLDADLSLFAGLIAGSRDSYRIEKRYVRRDSSIVWAVLQVGAIRAADGTLQTIVSQIDDITDRKDAEKRLAHQLLHDPLTGLPNHANIKQKLSRRLARGERLAVLFCDVDRFKAVNDCLGRDVGDQLLMSASHRLVLTLPSGCSLGSAGDDSFVVVAPDVRDEADARRLAERILAAFRQPLSVGTIQHTLSISIGAALNLGGDAHADELLADAEQALRRAKQQGRAHVELYDPHQDHTETLEDLHLEQALRTAINTDDGLQVYLQPIVNIDDEAVVGAEALIRWEHPQRGLLQPAAFLPVAERSGLIVDLGWRMLDRSARAAAQSLRPGGPGWIAVNVSGTQLGRGVLPSAIIAALDANGVSPQCLHLEITETALVDASPRAIEEVRAVADLGVSIALDDFGTGYSSLSLLRDLPISVVKIDRTFTVPIAENRRIAALVRSVVAMCNALDITTIAEGIETREQLALVRALGCDQAQGYLFGRAAPLD